MNNGKIYTAEFNHVPVLKFTGDIRVLLSGALDQYFSSLYQRPILDSLVVDLTETEGIDSTALGLLAKMAIQLRNRFNVTPTILSTNEDITSILKSMSMDLITDIVEDDLEKDVGYQELSQLNEKEEEIRKRVIDAHQTLMNLSEENRREFQELVAALKSGN